MSWGSSEMSHLHLYCSIKSEGGGWEESAVMSHLHVYCTIRGRGRG